MSNTMIAERPATLDLVVVAGKIVDAAVAVTTGRMHLTSPRETRGRLLAGDAVAVGYFRHELARLLATELLELDGQVQAIYEDEDVPAAEEVAPDVPTLTEPLHLYLVVILRTAALVGVVRALNRALHDALGGILPEPPGGYLAVTILDERETRLLAPRAWGYRPAPALLAAREPASSRG